MTGQHPEGGVADVPQGFAIDTHTHTHPCQKEDKQALTRAPARADEILLRFSRTLSSSSGQQSCAQSSQHPFALIASFCHRPHTHTQHTSKIRALESAPRAVKSANFVVAHALSWLRLRVFAPGCEALSKAHLAAFQRNHVDCSAVSLQLDSRVRAACAHLHRVRNVYSLNTLISTSASFVTCTTPARSPPVGPDTQQHSPTPDALSGPFGLYCVIISLSFVHHGLCVLYSSTARCDGALQ